jgi:uncharacterized protein (UPF0335 family)
MEDITNVLLQSRKRKLVDNIDRKENIEKKNINNAKIKIISQPISFGFDLGINSAINCKFYVYKEFLLNLKSLKVSTVV